MHLMMICETPPRPAGADVDTAHLFHEGPLLGAAAVLAFHRAHASAHHRHLRRYRRPIGIARARSPIRRLWDVVLIVKRAGADECAWGCAIALVWPSLSPSSSGHSEVQLSISSEYRGESRPPSGFFAHEGSSVRVCLFFPSTYCFN